MLYNRQILFGPVGQGPKMSTFSEQGLEPRLLLQQRQNGVVDILDAIHVALLQVSQLRRHPLNNVVLSFCCV